MKKWARNIAGVGQTLLLIENPKQLSKKAKEVISDTSYEQVDHMRDWKPSFSHRLLGSTLSF